MKKIICFFVIILLITGLVSSFCLYSQESVEVAAYSGNYYDAEKVYQYDKYGVRLSINGTFNGVSLYMPTWATTDVCCTVSLYKWVTDYNTTLSGVPVTSERFENIIDCGRNTVNTPSEMPAGEYLVLISQISGTAGLWLYNSDNSNTILYKNGVEAFIDVSVSVWFTSVPEIPFLKCESQITGEVLPPPEYVPKEDDVLKTHEVMPDTWVATDGLGRTLVTNAEVGGPKADRSVGMFFWTWHVSPFTDSEAFNVNNFIEEHPEAAHKYYHEGWPTTPTTYFWNEPIYGYYTSEDQWVVRKQAELLANAGVDAVFTDNTNATWLWQSGYTALYEGFAKAKNGGVNTPKVSYMLPFAANDYSRTQLSYIYQDIYRQNKYQDQWFYWDGKPMLMCYTDNLNSSDPLEKEILGFFTTRKSQPSYTARISDDFSWGWLSTYKQAVYYVDGVAEQTTVGVALNHNYKTGALSAMNGRNIMGRTYISLGYDERENAKLYGANFARQFENALSIGAKMTFITGWNEWTAGRYEEWPEGGTLNAFPDEYNDEFSRDIEPSKGDLKDHYYYQLVDYVRKLKGCRPIPVPTLASSIDIHSGTEQWEDVGPYFAAYINNTDDRDAKGHGSLYYTETSGRNDIAGVKIARDEDNVYILVECSADITPYTDPLWMNVYLDTDQNNQGWETFDYVINKTSPSEDTAVLEHFTGIGYETTKVGDVSYTVDGKYMQICVPKQMLNLSGYDFTVNISVTDNVHDENDSTKFSGDIMDFYISGDVAPGARFKFSYISTLSNSVETDNSSKTALYAGIGVAAAAAAASAAIVITKKKKTSEV